MALSLLNVQTVHSRPCPAGQQRQCPPPKHGLRRPADQLPPSSEPDRLKCVLASAMPTVFNKPIPPKGSWFSSQFTCKILFRLIGSFPDFSHRHSYLRSQLTGLGTGNLTVYRCFSASTVFPPPTLYFLFSLTMRIPGFL